MCKGHCMGWETYSRPDPKDPKKRISERRQVYKVCVCDCHKANPPRCTVCNSSDYEMVDARCVDGELCQERLAEVLGEDDLYQRLLASGRAGAIAKAEDRERRRESDPDAVRKPRGEAKPTSGRCEHCGEPTKGGRFVAGHDAKLKGDLKRAAEGGDVDSLVELLVRCWPTHTAKVTDEFRAQAQAQYDEAGQSWLAARVEARIS